MSREVAGLQHDTSWHPITEATANTFLRRFENFDGAELRQLEIAEGAAGTLTFHAYEPGLDPLPSDKVDANRWVELVIAVSGVVGFTFRQQYQAGILQLDDQLEILFRGDQIFLVLDPLQCYAPELQAEERVRQSNCYIVGEAAQYRVVGRLQF